MRYVLLATLSALTFAPFGEASAQTAPKFLSCTGVFAKDSTHARVVKTFGAKNVRYMDVMDVEGELQKATVVFAKDRKRRLEFHWRETKARRTPEIRIWADESQWKTEQGIGIGTTLERIVELNGKPFNLSGFGWDYGGIDKGFEGGKLEKLPGGCLISLRFTPGVRGDEAFRQVIGDETFSSDDPNMRALKPVVQMFSILWGE
jgi:hypothetical protein